MITDEELSRYLDGELAEDEAETVRRAVAGDPGLAARVERLRAVDRVFTAAVRAIDAAPTRADVASLLALSGPNHDQFTRRASSAPVWRIATAMAATLVLGIFGGAMFSGVSAPRSTTLALGVVPAQSGLAHALNTAASGEESSANKATLRPLLTFRSSGGEICREFRWKHGAAGAHGVACRSDGVWTVRVAGAEAPDAKGGYRAASSDSAIDAFVAEAMAGEPLSAAEERSALSAEE